MTQDRMVSNINSKKSISTALVSTTGCVDPTTPITNMCDKKYTPLSSLKWHIGYFLFIFGGVQNLRRKIYIENGHG